MNHTPHRSAERCSAERSRRSPTPYTVRLSAVRLSAHVEAHVEAPHPVQFNRTEISYLYGAATAIALSLLPIWTSPALAIRRQTAPSPAPASPQAPSPKTAKITPPLRPYTPCPTELEPLMEAMLRDLPSYLNRINHQKGNKSIPRYAIAASPANLNPLPIASSSNLPPTQGGLYQAFFTVLERQYENQNKQEFQNYHWLFLAQNATGWQLATLYSRLGAYPANSRYPSALQDTTQQTTGQAIRLWLRDCQAGTIAPVKELRK